MKIEVYDNKSNKKLGYENFPLEVYVWHHDIVCSFDFIVEDELKKDYSLGKFLIKDCVDEKQIDDETVKFFVGRYKFLCINKNPSKQFDDYENSKWEEFPKNVE